MATGSSIGSLAGTIGGSFLGPLGSAGLGAVGGLVGGLFDGPEEEVPAWQQYSDPRIAAIISRLMRSNLGEKQATAVAGRNTRNANRQMEQLGNDPRFSGNPITTAALRNQMSLGAEESNVGARLAGAQQDQQAQIQAAQLQQGQQAYSAQRNAFEQGRYQLQQQPTGLDTLAGSALGYAFGNALGDPTGNSTAGQPPEPTPGQTMSQMQTDGLYAPFRGRMDERSLSSTLNQGQFQYNPPQFQPYQLGPVPSSMFNYNYGYSPLRR